MIKSVLHKGDHLVIWKTELIWTVGSNFLGKVVCGLTCEIQTKYPVCIMIMIGITLLSVDHIGENGNPYNLDFSQFVNMICYSPWGHKSQTRLSHWTELNLFKKKQLSISLIHSIIYMGYFLLIFIDLSCFIISWWLYS